MPAPTRREVIKMGAAYVSGIEFSIMSAQESATIHSAQVTQVERWDKFELALRGPTSGNPFVDITFSVRFTCENYVMNVDGFYDGNGEYRARFMPEHVGVWHYVSVSNHGDLDHHSGSFTCIPPSPRNHGPVRVANRFHFQFADGTLFLPFGTTCYSFGFLGRPYTEEVLDGLRASRFNKVRMCLLTKPSSDQKPVCVPFPRLDSQGVSFEGERPPGVIDTSRFDPEYFRGFEEKIQLLGELGIEAELILFYKGDAVSTNGLDIKADERYLRYAINRFAAFRNVWWSIANEYDLIHIRTLKDWDHYFNLIQQNDPYSHLRSIHHSRIVYDHSRPWVTHASLQAFNFEKAKEYRVLWNKPIIWDEIQYEGNISARWGNLCPEEMTRRFWQAIVSGTYATHGETFNLPAGSNVWTIGGQLRGQSAPRIGFLRTILEQNIKSGLTEVEEAYYPCASEAQDLLLYYFDYHRPINYEFSLPRDIAFSCLLIDPWAMNSTLLPGIFSGKCKIPLSDQPYRAVLFRRI